MRSHEAWAWAGFFPAAAALALLAACAGPAPAPVPEDHRVAHPLGIEREQVSLALDVAPGEAPGGIDALELEEFVERYLAQGRAPLRIMVGGDEQLAELVLAPARHVKDFAVARGVRAADIEIYLEPMEGRVRGPVVLGYDRLTATLPECGHWRVPFAQHIQNRPHPNFGCATQRYTGMMVAEPADLFRARPAGLHDTERSNRVIEQYRAGEPTAREIMQHEREIQTEALR